MKRIVNKMPIISSGIITVLFLGIIKLVNMLWTAEGIAELFLHEAIFMLIPFLFVVIFGDIKVYAKGNAGKTVAAGGYLAVSQSMLFALMLSSAIVNPETKWQSPVGILYGIVMLFGIGFREESIFRGLFVDIIAKKYAKDRRGIFIAVIVSGVVFGLMHMTNIFTGVGFFGAMVQSVVAIGAGFYFAAVYLRGGSLWALIIMHALTDAASMFMPIFTMDGGSAIDTINNLSAINLLPFFMLSGISLFLLRKQKCDEIIARYQKTPE